MRLRNITLQLLAFRSNSTVLVLLFSSLSMSCGVQPVNGLIDPTESPTNNEGESEGEDPTDPVDEGDDETNPRIVRLIWDANTDQIDGYKIYIGRSSGNYYSWLDTTATTIDIPIVSSGTYYFVATAFRGDLHSSYIESGYSNEVTVVHPSVNGATSLTDRTSILTRHFSMNSLDHLPLNELKAEHPSATPR